MSDGVTKATHNQYTKCENDNSATGILKRMFTVYSKTANIRTEVTENNNAAEMLA
jgi:transposase-like protein